jgi:hypothetical protein
MQVWAGPQFVVMEPDTPWELLAVAIEMDSADIEWALRELKAHMIHTKCPAGIFISLSETFFFSNEYLGDDPETIKLIGKCATQDLLGAVPPGVPERFFIEHVLLWLESLPLSNRAGWPPPVRDAIQWHIAPVLREGRLQSTGIGWRRNGY